MTDERLGDRLWSALERLPRGSGIVFRHYSLTPDERRALFARVAQIAARRRLVLLRAGRTRLARTEQGVHNGPKPVVGLWTRAVHTRRDLIAAHRDGVDLVFASPVFATESHPGARSLGRARFMAMVQDASMPVIALGGMTPQRARILCDHRIHGWAAIDWWADQKRKAVPI
ncbi:thiamine phosphate synthase [Stakelama marina]|nr:thiamine phosphate synthase [Stakelama marina]